MAWHLVWDSNATGSLLLSLKKTKASLPGHKVLRFLCLRFFLNLLSLVVAGYSLTIQQGIHALDDLGVGKSTLFLRLSTFDCSLAGEKIRAFGEDAVTAAYETLDKKVRVFFCLFPVSFFVLLHQVLLVLMFNFLNKRATR